MSRKLGLYAVILSMLILGLCACGDEVQSPAQPSASVSDVAMSEYIRELSETISENNDDFYDQFVGTWETVRGVPLWYFCSPTVIEFFPDKRVYESCCDKYATIVFHGEGSFTLLGESGHEDTGGIVEGPFEFTYSFSDDLLTLVDQDGDRATYARVLNENITDTNNDSTLEQTKDILKTVESNQIAEPVSLLGFWHSASDFSDGFKESYRFYDYGEVDYTSDDGTLYMGIWELENDNLLTFSHVEWDGDEYIVDNSGETTVQLQIEYIVSTEGQEVISIDGKTFWKLHCPVDVILGVPLFIDYQSDVEGIYSESDVIYVTSPGAYGDNYVLSYDGDLYDFKIVVFELEFTDDDILRFYNQEGIIYELEQLPQGTVVNFANQDIGTMYSEGFVFCDATGIYHAYAIYHGGRGLSAPIAKVKLLDH
ncbi:MAG: hypothetical protein FWG88_01380 [Oscillospiraceae bacterium]|nr:hypothetical protein [Oscillospiraceae bacterium]